MSDRADRLVELLATDELDLLLITALVNVRYMTGYTGTNGLALVGPQTRVFVTDFRYVEQAKAEVAERATSASETSSSCSGRSRARFPARARSGSVSTTPTSPCASTPGCASCCPTACSSSRPAGSSSELRAVKEPDEIERIRARRRAADDGLARGARTGTAGPYRARARGRARAARCATAAPTGPALN